MQGRTLCLAAVLMTAATSGTAQTQPNAFSGYSGNFLGLVIDTRSQRPLADVTVTASGTNLPTKTGKTNADGNYGILQLPYGTYTLTFDKIGYERMVSTGNAVSAQRKMVEVNGALRLKAAEASPEMGTDRQ